jgi:hypothetical protein
MISLSDEQLQTVLTAARNVPVEKRSVFLERVAASLQYGPRRTTDADVERACERVARGLIQQRADSVA